MIISKVTRKRKTSKNIWSICNERRINIFNIRALKINKKKTNAAIKYSEGTCNSNFKRSK